MSARSLQARRRSESTRVAGNARVGERAPHHCQSEGECSDTRGSVGSNKLRHETLQRFMLVNDSVTVAIEIPIWLTEDDKSALEREHGIELAVRIGDAPRALTRLVPGLKLFDIKCAWFNEQEYCEMFPRTLFIGR